MHPSPRTQPPIPFPLLPCPDDAAASAVAVTVIRKQSRRSTQLLWRVWKQTSRASSNTITQGENNKDGLFKNKIEYINPNDWDHPNHKLRKICIFSVAVFCIYRMELSPSLVFQVATANRLPRLRRAEVIPSLRLHDR